MMIDIVRYSVIHQKVAAPNIHALYKHAYHAPGIPSTNISHYIVHQAYLAPDILNIKIFCTPGWRFQLLKILILDNPNFLKLLFYSLFSIEFKLLTHDQSFLNYAKVGKK